jgi:hypothetical protein
VYAIREQRKESWLTRAAYAAFYRLLQRVANIEIPLDAGDFCIMDRRVVDLLIGMPERNRFVRGIRSWVGLDQVGLAYAHSEATQLYERLPLGRELGLPTEPLVTPDVRAFLEQNFPKRLAGDFVIYTLDGQATTK